MKEWKARLIDVPRLWPNKLTQKFDSIGKDTTLVHNPRTIELKNWAKKHAVAIENNGAKFRRQREAAMELGMQGGGEGRPEEMNIAMQ
jgi:hypothetical protein